MHGHQELLEAERAEFQPAWAAPGAWQRQAVPRQADWAVHCAAAGKVREGQPEVEEQVVMAQPASGLRVRQPRRSWGRPGCTPEPPREEALRQPGHQVVDGEARGGGVVAATTGAEAAADSGKVPFRLPDGGLQDSVGEEQRQHDRVLDSEAQLCRDVRPPAAKAHDGVCNHLHEANGTCEGEGHALAAVALRKEGLCRRGLLQHRRSRAQLWGQGLPEARTQELQLRRQPPGSAPGLKLDVGGHGKQDGLVALLIAAMRTPAHATPCPRRLLHSCMV
mmetsp:Transcript_72723/g.229821  ORF Transcript_72723/g.229821 Transcript_72723/m.229821 type:complete len:278 (-) Transcript_72723:424-1257(-)